MTLADLKGLSRVRNAFLNRRQLRFTLDLANHDIWPGEIDPSLEADVNGAREWQTPFGRLLERKGVLSLEPVDLDVRSGYSSRVAGGRVQKFLHSMGRSMQYRVQFLDRMDIVIREVRADDRSARTVLFRRSINRACPPHGVRMRVLDQYGRTSVSRNLGRELLSYVAR